MNYFVHILLGYAMAFVGVLPPGMLNMTAMKTGISVNKKAGLLFGLGAALIVVPQSFIALYFAGFFARHPEVIENLSIAGVVVLFLLGFFFLWQARRKTTRESKVKRGNYLLIGMVMSSLNMLAIPYYLVYSTILEGKGYLILDKWHIVFFVIGAFLGAFSIFALYVLLSGILVSRVRFIAKNINYILGFLFLTLGILLLIDLLNK